MKAVEVKDILHRSELPERLSAATDVYFSVDIETDGAIPGPNSMLSFALVYSGTFDGTNFSAPKKLETSFYRELKPISDDFDPEALRVNRLDRLRLISEGADPYQAMTEAATWVNEIAQGGSPVCVAYPLSFDWSWLYWYFVRFSSLGSPFGFSRCFDLKTAVSVKLGIPVSASGRDKLPKSLRGAETHSHHALDDAVEQAIVFQKVFSLEV